MHRFSWSRFTSAFWTFLAAILPPQLVYFATIRLFAHATAGVFGRTVVPGLSLPDALERWALCNSCGGLRGRHVCTRAGNCDYDGKYGSECVLPRGHRGDHQEPDGTRWNLGVVAAIRQTAGALLMLAVIGAAALWPVFAFADELATQPAASQTLLESVLQHIVAPAIPVIGTVITALLVMLAKFLHSKEKESKAFAALAQLSELIRALVANSDVVKKDVQAALANDGKIDATEWGTIKVHVLELVKTQAPAGLLAIVQALFGAAFEGWLNGTVERAISDHQQTLATSAAGVNPPTP